MNTKIKREMKADHRRLSKELRELERLMAKVGVEHKVKRRKKATKKHTVGHSIQPVKPEKSAPKASKKAKSKGNGKSASKSAGTQGELFPAAPVQSTKAEKAAALRAQRTAE